MGGGDFARDRIVPDIYRAVRSGTGLVLRNPDSIRPWQHVLEPLIGYMELADAMLGEYDSRYSSAWNFGPGPESFVTVRHIAQKAKDAFGGGFSWTESAHGGKGEKEAAVLKLDSSKALNVLGWEPKLGIDCALENTFSWYKALMDKQDVNAVVNGQIDEYLGMFSAS